MADPLSRLSVQKIEAFDEDSEVYINAIISSAAVDIKEVETASEADEILQKLKLAIDSRDFEDPQLGSYKYFKEQLGYLGNIVIRGNQVFFCRLINVYNFVLTFFFCKLGDNAKFLAKEDSRVMSRRASGREFNETESKSTLLVAEIR